MDGWMDLTILTRGIEGNAKIILRVKAAVGSWQESSAGGSAVGTGGRFYILKFVFFLGIVPVSTRGSRSSVHGSGM